MPADAGRLLDKEFRYTICRHIYFGTSVMVREIRGEYRLQGQLRLPLGCSIYINEVTMNEQLQVIYLPIEELLPDGKHKRDTIQHLKRLKRKLRLLQR